MEEKTTIELLEETIADKVEKLAKLEPGGEEHSRLCEDISRLTKVWTEQYKAECDMYNQNHKIENEKARDDEEIKIKKLLAELEERKSNRIKPDTIFTCGVVCILTGATCWFEAKGHIFPTKLLKWADKIKTPILG